jgi:hypothetical protein
MPTQVVHKQDGAYLTTGVYSCAEGMPVLVVNFFEVVGLAALFQTYALRAIEQLLALLA